MLDHLVKKMFDDLMMSIPIENIHYVELIIEDV